MQGSQLRGLAMWRMGRYRKVGVIERKFENFSQVEFSVVTEACASVRGGMLALCDTEFPAVKAICLLAGPIGHGHEDLAFIVFFD